jgi:hypothetical protein
MVVLGGSRPCAGGRGTPRRQEPEDLHAEAGREVWQGEHRAAVGAWLQGCDEGLLCGVAGGLGACVGGF